MGLASRTALALAVTAVVAVAVSAMLVEIGLDDRARQVSEQRLRSAARHAAELAADEYAERGRWTRAAVQAVEHAAAIPGYRAAVFDASGRRIAPVAHAGSRPVAAVARAPVLLKGRPVGRLQLQASRALVAAEERDLADRVMSLHLLAALLAAAAALLAVPVLAATVVRPITRLRAAVAGLRSGTRASTRGPREVAELASAFNAMADDLDREEQARRVMAADVAHELRTPLNGMLLRIEGAQDGVLADPGAYLEAMHADARRLGRLIDDIEQLAAAERPGLLLERVPLNIADLVRDRVQVHAASLAEHEIDLTASLRDVRAEVDPERLGQVVDNLLSNVIRYTDPGGTVALLVAEDDGEAVIEVCDTGIGIPPEDLLHVFDRFWRADRSRSRATGGAGVGLAVAERLTAAHGGSIEVASQLGRGSRFTVRLPLAG